MRKGTLGFVFGLIVGGVVTALSILKAMPGMMIVNDASAFGFDSTVAAIEERALEEGWKVPKRYRLDQTLAQEGYKVPPVAVIELCKPEYSALILRKDDSRAASALMPCRIAVYETSGGSVRVSRMNSQALSRFFPGHVGSTMGRAAAESEAFMAEIFRMEKR